MAGEERARYDDGRDRGADGDRAPEADDEHLAEPSASVDPATADPAAPLLGDPTVAGAPDPGVTVMPPALARLQHLPVPDDPADPAITDEDLEGYPFGLAVLSEVPQLAMLLEDLRRVDRLLADAIDAILLLEDTALAEATTGVGIDTWLSIVGRRTAADTRMLRTTATIMRRLPTLHEAFRSGAVSWAQVRSVVLAVRPLPGHLDEKVDAAIADALVGARESGPDALTRTIRWHLADLDPTKHEHAQDTAERAEYLAMQPRLDGTGGRFWGELGPTNFAILDAAVNTGPFTDHPDDPDDQPNGSKGSGPTPIALAGRARLHRLIDHLEHSLADRINSNSTPPPAPPPPAHRCPARRCPGRCVRGRNCCYAPSCPPCWIGIRAPAGC